MMYRNYFKTAIRNLLRNRVYAFINIAGLSLGLACAMLIILYVKDEVSYDRFHKNGDSIFRMVRQIINADGKAQFSDGYTGYPEGPQFTAAIPGVKGFVRLQNTYTDIKKGSLVNAQQCLQVDPNFFSVFSFPLSDGDKDKVLLQPRSVVITEEMAMKEFGTVKALGKIMQVKEDGAFEPYLVTGVAKRCPQNSTIKFDMVTRLNISASQEHASEAWLNVFLNTFLVLKPGADVKVVEAAMKKIYATNAAEDIKIAREKYDSKWTPLFLLQELTAMHLSKAYPPIDGLTDASDPAFSYILSGIALFILLIACINFVNLTVARSLKRAKEIGIRKVSGGNRKQLILQFLGESFMLCFISFSCALFIVEAILPLFNHLSGKALELSYLVDAKLVAGYIILFLITGLLAGFYPALVLSNYNPVQTLYGRLNFNGKNYLQKSLVVLQFSLASFLIIATMTIFSQFNYLTNKKLGDDENGIVVIDHWGLEPAKAALMRQELMTHPDILGVAPKNIGFYNTQAKVTGENKVPTVVETVDESYIPLLKIPVINGRNFSKDFPSDSSHSVVVNETFVRQAGWKEPIGKEVNFWYDGGQKYTVVGVVKDYHFQSLGELIKPQLFSLKQGRGFGSLYIKIKPNSESRSLAFIESVYKKTFPLSPYSYVFKNEANSRNYAAEYKWKQIMLFGAIVTVFISCIGLFGLSVLSAEKRIKEIGIRKILGASVAGVVSILSKDFLKLVFAALLVAIPVAWLAANKWLQNYPYRIALSWPMFAIAAILVTGIALATVCFQAFRAAVTSPAKSLRTD